MCTQIFLQTLVLMLRYIPENLNKFQLFNNYLIKILLFNAIQIANCLSIDSFI